MSTISKTIHISDTVHGSIPISYLEKIIISTRIFNRLHNVSQNSTAYLTYPTNRTRRFEHSIGTMHICSQMFMYGINNADTETLESFFMDLEDEIDSILRNKLSEDGNHIYRAKLDDANFKESVLFNYKENIQIDDYLYRLSIPKHILDNKLEVPYIILFQSIRLAAMLHDIGHPPMSHITENAIQDIFKKTESKEDKNLNELEFIECIKYYYKDNKKFALHEKIGISLSKRLLEHSIIPYHKYNNPEKLYKILFELIIMDVTISILDETTSFFKWIHRIIDGSLDGDRLDYVTRDPMNSGIDTGKIEYDRLLSTMKLIKYKDNSYWFCPHIKMVDIVDDFFYRRWMMYKKIILHHRVVKTDYLMESCIQEISEDYFNGNLSLESKDISEDALPYDISGIWKGVKIQASYEGVFDTVLQWDDGWLLTILKKHFYSDYKKVNSGKTYYKLEELISNKKSYYSLLKKDADSLLLDKNVIEKISLRSQESLCLISKLKNLRENEGYIREVGDIYGPDQMISNIDPFLETLIFFFKHTNKIYSTGINSGDYILSFFRFELGVLFPNKLIYNEIIEESLKETMKNYDDIEEWFYQVKPMKTGIDQNLMLYSEEQDGKTIVHLYEQISNSNFVLEKYRNSLIPVYIYLRKKDENAKVNFENIIKELGSNIGDKICDEIESYLRGLIKIKEGEKCVQ